MHKLRFLVFVIGCRNDTKSRVRSALVKGPFLYSQRVSFFVLITTKGNHLSKHTSLKTGGFSGGDARILQEEQER